MEETETDFIGRDRELRELRAGLDNAASGRGRLFLVAGEAGIGKTSLAGELARLATLRGARIAWGGCWEGGGAPAYWPWAQVVSGLLRSADARQRLAELGVAATYVTSIAAVRSAERTGASSVAAPSPAEGSRFDLFRAIAGFLTSVSAPSPLLVLLDDLHAADGPSLQLLRFVAQEIRSSPIVVVGAYRALEASQRAEIAPLLAELARGARTLPLSGLDREQVGRLMARTSGSRPSHQVISAAHRVTEGNPLFVDELTRWLAAEGRLDDDAIARGEIQLPAGLRQTIRARIRPLAEATHEALAVAAAIGREFDLGVLQRAGELDAEAALQTLGEAVAAGVLTEVPGRLGTYAFAHSLLRETLYAEIAPERRAKLHARIGVALEELHPAGLDDRVSELAFHFCAASVAGEGAKAVGYAQRAGERALALFAYEEAATHFERGLKALELSAQSVEERLGGEGLLELTRAEEADRAGDLGFAGDDARRAAVVGCRLRALGLLARAAYADGGFAIDEYAPPSAPATLLEEALAALDEHDDVLRARILARLSRLRVLSDSWQRRLALSRDAIALARRVGDRTALSYALDAFELVSWADGPTAERIAAADELTRLARETDDSELQVHARLWRVGLAIERGDLEATDRELAEHASDAVRLGHPQLAWTVAVLEGMRAAVAGRFADAQRCLDDAVAIAQRSRIRPAARILAMQFLVLRRECGNLAEVEPALRHAVERFPPSSVYRAALALVCAELGRSAEAQVALDALAVDDFASLTRDSSWPVSVAFLAEVCALLGDAERAANLYAAILPRDESVLGVIVACLGPAAYYLGILASTMGRFDDARRHFEGALRLSRKIAAEPHEARIEAAYGRMLDKRGGPGDGDEAIQRTRRALEIGRRLGMRSVVERLEASTPVRRRAVEPGDARTVPGEGWPGSFVGRERELAEIDAVLRGVRSGQGALVLVAGEPGVGKTRLLTEIARRAARDGVTLARAASAGGLGAPPYRLWAQVLRELRADGTGALAGEPAAGAAPLGSELQDLLPASPLAAGALDFRDSAESRFQLFDGVAAALRRLAQRAPIAVLLDDLQWADESSIILLGFLARELARDPVVFVAAYRDVEARLLAEVGRRIGELACDARTVRLEGLTEPEVAELVERATGRPAEGRASAIRRVTGGNPLFVEELLRSAGQEGGLDSQLTAGAPLPERVRAVIGKRTQIVSPACRRMLSVAAVVGKDVDAAMLAAVCTRLGDPRPEETIDEAGSARILIVSERRLSFAHDLFRETLYDALRAHERARIHAAAGEALEELHAGELDLCLPDLAQHFFRAGASQGAKAVRYSLRAAERASRSHAHAEAVGHYRRALEVLASPGEADSAGRCRVLLALGESLWSAGEFEEARATYERAADLAEALGLDAELARAALGFGGQDVSFDGGVVEPRLIALLDRALVRCAEGDGILRASLTARLAAALAFSTERARGAALAEEAVAIARRTGDPPTLHFALSCLIAATWGPDDLERRLAVSRETTELAAAMGGVRAAEMHGALMTALLESGDAAAAEREAEAYRQRTALAGRRISIWFLAVRRTMIALLEGRFAEVEALAAHALRLGSEDQNRNAAQYYGAQLLALRREQGRLDEMVGAVEQFMQAYPAVPAWRATLVWVYAESGRDADARLELERIAAAEFNDLPRDMFWLLCLWLLAEAIARLGDVRRAEMLYTRLLPYAGRCVTSGAAFCAGSLERSLGQLATVLGRYDDAEGHFTAAIAANERIGARPWVAHTEHDWARMLLARARPGDLAHAEDRLRRVAASARALGMPCLLARAEALLAAPPEPARERGDDAAMCHEGEYWTLAYGGRSARVRDARGLRLLALLLASPGRDFRAVDLAAWPAAPLPAGVVSAAAARDAGLTPVEVTTRGSGPDARAIAEYRSRLAELRDEADEAESFNDPLRAARAREEIERLSEEVALAARQGGRRASSDAERARLSVTKAIRYALDKVERAHPDLGRHLAASVKTGTTCRYEPDPRSPLRWTL